MCSSKNFTFGKYVAVSKNVPIKATKHVKIITLYSSLIEEVRSMSAINESTTTKNVKVTIIRLDSSPSFLK